MIFRALLLAMALVVMCETTPAQAQDEGWARRIFHMDRVEKWREQRRQRAALAARQEAIRREAARRNDYVQVQPPQRQAQHPGPTRVYGYVQREQDARRRGDCLAPRAVVGLERYNLQEARDNAISLWMEAEKLHNGVKYMNPENAIVLSADGKGPDCYLSSTGNRASEKLAEQANKVLHQCEFRARPCSGNIGADQARR